MKKKDWEDEQPNFLPKDKRLAKKYLKARKKYKASKAVIFLPRNEIGEKKQKRLVTKSRSYLKQRKKRRHIALGLAATFVAGTLGGFLLYNQIKAIIYNNAPPSKNPHTSEDVIDPNGNDFEYGDDGQIVFDKMTEEEKNILSDKLEKLLLNDANSRNLSDTKIEKIKEIISISLIPCNMCDENNQYDKYYLSILFNDGKKTYALNYLTGKDFDSTAELSSNLVADFVNYIEYDCALDSCSTMTETGLSLKNLLGESSTFVGDAFWGYMPSGEEYYFIPTYEKDGAGVVYYAQAFLFGGTIEEENPNKALFDDLSNSQNIFSKMDFGKSENLQKVQKSIQDNLKFEEKQDSAQDTKQESAAYAAKQNISSEAKQNSHPRETIFEMTK